MISIRSPAISRHRPHKVHSSSWSLFTRTRRSTGSKISTGHASTSARAAAVRRNSLSRTEISMNIPMIQDRFHKAWNLRKFVRHVDSRLPHDFDFPLSASPHTLDDDGCMAKSSPRHLIDELACHERDDRFRMLLGGIVRSEMLFHAPPGLAENGHRFSLRIILKEAEKLREVQPDDRVTANANTRRLANPVLGEQIRDFAGHAAASGNHTDCPIRETPTRIVHAPAKPANLGNAQSEKSKTVGSYDPGSLLLRRSENLHDILSWNALCEDNDKFDAAFQRLEGSVSYRQGRHRNDTRIDPVLLDGPPDGVVDPNSGHVLPAFAGRHARQDPGAVVERIFDQDAGFPTSYALDDYGCILVSQNAHETPPRSPPACCILQPQGPPHRRSGVLAH